jgi:hypothetical protein
VVKVGHMGGGIFVQHDIPVSMLGCTLLMMDWKLINISQKHCAQMEISGPLNSGSSILFGRILHTECQNLSMPSSSHSL